MPTIDVSGDRLHYAEEPAGRGDAPTVVMVHGSCGGAGQWKRLADALREDFHIVRVDLPGMGSSEPYPLDRVWTLEDDAAALTALIDHLDRPVHFVGHSGGCLFSWRALEARAGQVQSITLFEPVFFKMLREAGDPSFGWTEEVATGYRKRVEAEGLEAALAFFVDRWAGVDGAWEKTPSKVQDMMRLGAARLYHEWGDTLYGDTAPPSAPTCRTLLLEGSDSPPPIRAIGDRLATLWPPFSRHRIAGAGHMLPFTHADAVAPIVRKHILGEV